MRRRYAPVVELDVRHLRALCAIADTGSMRKAARQLGMSQPSLTTQLRRIERTIGGLLFTRERTGSLPTPLGRSVLSRARPILADMSALVTAARDAAVNAQGARLRLGSSGSRAIPGWLRRLHTRLPDTDTTIHIDMSANTLLRMVAEHQLDVAFVHELDGFPLRVPAGLEQRVVADREPQFIAMASTHPLAGLPAVPLHGLAEEQWMADPTVDDECAAMRRAFTAAGLNPRLVYVRDVTTAAELVSAGEAVSLCQPTSMPRHGMAIRPLQGDPLTVRLLMFTRTPSAENAPANRALFDDLVAAYREVAWANPTYRQWLLRHDSPLLHSPGTPGGLADAGILAGSVAGTNGTEFERSTPPRRLTGA
ncbi:LysR family transcriptional regulator [Streptomyces meridianus]|nr:LysR family transcriptional regulator [Streptomyces meridianus]